VFFEGLKSLGRRQLESGDTDNNNMSIMTASASIVTTQLARQVGLISARARAPYADPTEAPRPMTMKRFNWIGH